MQVLSVLLTISTVIESNGSLSVLRMRESVCARCLSVMTKRRVSALVTASVLSVGCSASAAVCRADGLQEAREKAASIIKAILQSFIFFIFISFYLLFRAAKLRKREEKALGTSRKVDAEGESLNKCSGVL